VLVIEHNLDVIKTADWVVDLGPEGGDGGGRILAAGTPEAISRAGQSVTGRALAKVLTKPNVRTIFPGDESRDGRDKGRADARRDPRRRVQARKQAGP
jgi:excinuclease ABC subunit A